MTEQTITLSLPEPVLRKLQRAALLTYRSMDEVVASTIDAVLVAPEGLPPELADELTAMHLLSDDALWAATQPSISPAEQERLGQLNHLAGESDLSPAEDSRAGDESGFTPGVSAAAVASRLANVCAEGTKN